MTPFGVIVGVGPGEEEVRRVEDLLESLWHFEPAVSSVVLVDDELRPRPLEQRFEAPSSCRLVSIPHPRRGRGLGVSEGLAAAVLIGFRWLVDHSDATFAVKLDTDSLVIGPFAAPIAAAFAADPDVGELGWYGLPGSEYWAAYIRKLAKPVSFWRRRGDREDGRLISERTYVRMAFWGKQGRTRAQIKAALAQGYAFGEHCQGGGYAVSRTAIERLDRAGYLDEPLLWLGTGCGEDTLIALLVRAAGLRLADLSGLGRPFHVAHLGLPDSPQNLLAAGTGITHSVRTDATWTEDDLRAFFARARRDSVAATR
jgi:hypothetical protein